MARKYGHDRGVAEPAIIVMERAFHGRSLATLSATGSRKVQAGFEPLVQGFVRVPLNDLEAVRQVAEHNRNVVAVLVEPIQGRASTLSPKISSTHILLMIWNQLPCRNMDEKILIHSSDGSLRNCAGIRP